MNARSRALGFANALTFGVHPHGVDVTLANYLRAAQAYMLISMPTGTSTILGAFQAIVLSFSIGTIFVLNDKLPRHEKFASGIFFV